MVRFRSTSLEGNPSKTRHLVVFSLPVPKSTLSKRLHPDKAMLRQRVIELRSEGKTLHEIADILCISSSRVDQILKNS